MAARKKRMICHFCGNITLGTKRGKPLISNWSRHVGVFIFGGYLFIHKTTAVWLMQEGERISSDRLFRVRSKQPFATQVYNQINKQKDGVKALICATINIICDVCVFRHSERSGG